MNGNRPPAHGSGTTTARPSSLAAAAAAAPADSGDLNHHHPTSMLPPGFAGDALRAAGGGTASAPPPGFHHDARADQRRRDQAAAMMLLHHSPHHAQVAHAHQQQQFQQRHHHAVDGGGGGGGPGPGLSLSGPADLYVDGDSGKRTTSFVNLAQALGESMAQVMDDSLLGRSNHGGVTASAYNSANHGGLNSTHAPIVEDDPSCLYGGGTSSPPPQSSGPNKEQNQCVQRSPGPGPAPHHNHHHPDESYGMDNYQRQSRHISSRLIGPKTGHHQSSPLMGSTAAAVSALSPGGGGGFHPSGASTQQQTRQLSTSHQSGLRSEDGSARGDIGGVQLSQHTRGVMPSHRNSAELRGANGSPIHRQNHRRSSGDGIPTETSSPPPGAGLEIQRRRMEASLALSGGDAPLLGVGGRGEQFLGVSTPDRNRVGAEAFEDEEEMLLRGGARCERGRQSAPPELQLFGGTGTPFGHPQRQGPPPSKNGAAAPPSTLHKPVGLPLGHHHEQHHGGGQVPPSAAVVGSGSLTPSPNTILDLADRATIATASSSTSTSSSPLMQFHVDVADPSRATERELTPFLRDAMQSGREQPSAHPSRGLAVLLATCAARQLALADVRAGCDAFGSIESFRSDFWQSRGVIFLSYYDLRCAQRAAAELPAFLGRLVDAGTSAMFGSSDNEMMQEPKVKYCIPLQSSAPTDESTILVCNLPEDMDEQRLTAFMESFGGVRTVHYQMVSGGGMGGQGVDDDFDGPSYVVEFYDVQDAKQALLELQHAEPWGPCVQVEVGMRNPTKRRQAKDLLRLLGRWRLGSGSADGASHGDNRQVARRSSGQNVASPSGTAFIQRAPSRTPPPGGTSGSASASLSMAQKTRTDNFPSNHRKDGAKISTPVSVSPLPSATTSSPSSHGHRPIEGDSSAHTHRMYNPVHTHHESRQSQQQSHTQLVLGPNGQYSYVTVSSLPVPGGVAPQYGSHGQPYFPSPHPEQQPHYPGPQYAYVHDPHSHPHPGMQHHVSMPGHTAPQLVMPSYIDVRTGYPVNPVYLPVSGSNADSSVSSGGSGHPSQTNFSNDQKNRSRTAGVEKKGQSAKTRKGGGSAGVHGGGGTDDPALALDIDAVKSGRDVRTSLMVRNIPNKYTQKMLLEEFTDGGHGPDKMDFFYLPIDFKNRCNRGYAFVNFVDYRDIVAFHNQYNGNQWKVFNSDKICQITYARIQGKAAMLKRFEHSALLDKEVEYRPLVFYSHGPKKGEKEAFPSSSGTIDESPS